MQIKLSPEANKDFVFCQKSGNKTILKKIDNLIDAIIENPKTGIGKPELLKHNLSGIWSRRIDKEHRIVYLIEEDLITLLSLKGHY